MSAYIENRLMSSSDLPKLWTTSSKFAKFVLSKSSFGIKIQSNLFWIFFCEEYLTRRSTFINKIFWNFDFESTLFLKCAQFLSALFIIMVGLTMALFSEKVLISHKCLRGLMPNLIKKSWMVSNTHLQIAVNSHKNNTLHECMTR